ncbi:MAG: hypothetical protein ACI32E_01795 [Bacilli bacterium]
MRLNLKVIFLTFCHLVILNSIIGSNLAIYLSTQYAYFVPLLLGGVTIILFLLLPTPHSSYISKILKGHFLRFVLAIYLFLSTLVILYVVFKILAMKVYLMTPTYLLIIVSLFFIFLLGKMSLKNILSVKIIVYILVLFSTTIMFADTNEFNFRLLLPIDFHLDNHVKLLSLGFIYLDSLLYLFIPLNDKQVLSKWNFIIGTLLGSILSSWFIIYSYASLDYKFFIDLPFPSMYRYRIYAGPKYLEHLDIFFDFFVCAFFILKVTFNLELFRVYLKIKNSFFYRLILTIIIGLIVAFAFYHTDNNLIYTFYPCALLSAISFIIYAGLWRYHLYGKKTSP